MKKRIIVSSVVIITMVIFVVMQYVIGDIIGTGPKVRAEEPYYIERIGEENKMVQQANQDVNLMLDDLSKDSSTVEKLEKEISKNLQYCLENFPELRKGDNADMEIIKGMCYSLNYLYLMVINSDYDNSYITTEKEKKLMKTAIFQYVDVAVGYARDCSCLIQEEADFLDAKKKGRNILRNFSTEVKQYTEALVDVVREAKQNNLIS